MGEEGPGCEAVQQGKAWLPQGAPRDSVGWGARARSHQASPRRPDWEARLPGQPALLWLLTAVKRMLRVLSCSFTQSLY